MRARLEDDPQEDRRPVALEPCHARKRHPHLYVDIVADALPELQGAAHASDSALLPRHAAVSWQIFPGDGQYETVHISHVKPPEAAGWKSQPLRPCAARPEYR